MQNWKIKLSLFLNYFVFAILLNSSGTVILQVQNNFDVSAGAASWIDPCKDISIAVMSFIISSYITRLGYRKAMLWALGFISVVCFIMTFASSFLATKLLFVATGASFALIKMSVYSTIGLVTEDPKEHISLMNFLESFFMVGNLAGYFIFSYFVDKNNDAHSLQWFQVYYVLGGISLAAFLLLLAAPLDESSIKSDGSRSMTDEFGDMIKLMISPIVIAFIFSAFFYVLIEQSIQNFLPTFNNKVLLMSPALSIQMTSILAGSTAIGRFLAGIVLKKLNWFVVLVCCVVLAASLVLLAMPLAGNIPATGITSWFDAPLAAYVFPLIGLVIAPVYPAINSVILSSLPPRKHGLMSGLIIIFSALGGTTGSVITGHIFENFGGKTAFYFSLIPMAILLVLLYVFNRLQKRAGVKADISQAVPVH
ncbi:MAG TPA: MFS transporter [Chitinophagaceae bacterium]|nr:MFS transporter [Chitinophagaceae bacterium]